VHDDIDPALRARIAASAPPIEVEWLDVSSTSFEGAHLPDYLPRASLFRLELPRLLPDLDRVVYLDADILVRSPLTELWETELGACPAAAARDMGFPFAANVLPWQELGLPPDGPYYNSGVMVLALDRWRASGVGERALRLAQEHRFQLGDQCALNVALAGAWQRLPPTWNFQRNHLRADGLPWVVEPAAELAAAIESPAIVHFCGQRWNRPWQPECDHPYRADWYEALAATDWATWQPTRRSPVRRVGRKVKLATRALVNDPYRSPWP
jgi:lipopolysaccharide biosynthesis glycosyltransferase